MFDALTFVAALEAPTFTDLTGTKHVGRLLSHVEMSSHYAKLQVAYKQLDQDSEAVTKVMLAACEQMFNADAVTALTAMPGIALEAAMTDFFLSHRRQAATAAEPSQTSTSV